MKEDLLAGRCHAIYNIDDQHLASYVKDGADSAFPIWDRHFYHIGLTSNCVPNSRILPKQLFRSILYELSRELAW